MQRSTAIYKADWLVIYEQVQADHNIGQQE